MLICALLVAPPALAESGTQVVQHVVQIFTTWNGSKSDTRMYTEASNYIDYMGMAERSLTSAEWKKLSAAQKGEFVKTMRTLIEQRYYVRWHKLFSKGKLSYLGENKSGDETTVKSQLTIGKKVDPLNWLLARDKILSLSVGKSDLLTKLSTRLKGRLDKLGFNGLLTWMKNKANISPEESSDQATTTPAQ
jgi:hypothetical protein